MMTNQMPVDIDDEGWEDDDLEDDGLMIGLNLS